MITLCTRSHYPNAGSAYQQGAPRSNSTNDWFRTCDFSGDNKAGRHAPPRTVAQGAKHLANYDIIWGRKGSRLEECKP